MWLWLLDELGNGLEHPGANFVKQPGLIIQELGEALLLGELALGLFLPVLARVASEVEALL